MKLTDLSVIESLKKNHLEQITNAQLSQREVALVTNLATGAQEMLFSENLDVNSPVGNVVADTFRRRRSRLVELDGRTLFIQVFCKSLRLIIVGAVHIAKPLIEMGRLCGYAVTLIDPRLAFASQQRFPDVDCRHQWPDAALREMEPDRSTAVVTLTHDPKLDEPALIVALESEAFYVGALGSRRTHRSRCDRLRANGVPEQQLERISGPIGLDIGAESPAEIAVSIMAEMTQTLHRNGST